MSLYKASLSSKYHIFMLPSNLWRSIKYVSVLRNVNTLAVLQMNSEEDEGDFEDVQSLLSVLESLCSHCVYSKQCSDLIITAYRISMVSVMYWFPCGIIISLMIYYFKSLPVETTLCYCALTWHAFHFPRLYIGHLTGSWSRTPLGFFNMSFAVTMPVNLHLLRVT